MERRERASIRVRLIDSLPHRLIDRWIDRWIAGLIDWLIDGLIDELIDWLNSFGQSFGFFVRILSYVCWKRCWPKAFWPHAVFFQAILTGDYILSVASRELARLRHPDVIICIAQVIEDLVKGELMQLGSRDVNVTGRFDNYLSKTYHKTASLMANSCKAVSNSDHTVSVSTSSVFYACTSRTFFAQLRFFEWSARFVDISWKKIWFFFCFSVGF